MAITLIAVVVALALGHAAPGFARSVREYGWFRAWLRWLDERFPEEGFWRGRYGIVLALAPPLLAVLLWFIPRAEEPHVRTRPQLLKIIFRVARYNSVSGVALG